MTKDEIIERIENTLISENSKSQNKMGCYESYYNPYYLVGKCFTDKNTNVRNSELINMSESELNNLIKLADFASEVFY